METVAVNLLWHPQAQFAGYLVAAGLGFGAERGIRLRTTPLDFALGPVRSVLSGESQFGVASPANLLESDARGELRLLLVVQQDSPLVYPVRKELGIRRLAGLAGERVGVWPGNEDLELRWMLHKEGIGPDAVERVPMNDTVGPFLAGEITSAQVTIYHELHQIAAAGLPRERLDLFVPADYDAALVKDGLFTTRALVAERPDLVQAVVDTVLEGWAHAFARPDEAVRICVESWPGLDQEEQRMQYRDIRALAFRGAAPEHGLGFPDPVHLERAAAALRDLGEEVSEADRDAVLDARFWQAAPRAFKPRQ